LIPPTYLDPSKKPPEGNERKKEFIPQMGMKEKRKIQKKAP
jgi:hypothetical protein